jgi:hypothetical protein
MDSRWARVARGVAAGTIATLVAAASHGLAGGTFPGFAGVALALSFSAIVGMLLAGRRVSAWRLSASVILSQLAFHMVFSTIGGAGEVLAGGGHHDMGPLVISTSSDAVVHASAGMWFAHGIAALLTILALRHGEVAFWGLRDTARMLLAALLQSTPPLPVQPFARGHRAATVQRLVPQIAREFLEARGTRGPPLVLT